MKFSKCADLLQSLMNLSTNFEQRNRFSEVTQRITTQQASHVLVDVNKTNANRGVIGPICYNCRERGHFARNCGKPKRKVETKQVDRVHQIASDECVESEALINKIADKNTCVELCKEITIVGVTEVKCKALIDSGSSKSLVKRSIAEKCGLCVIECHEKLIGFAGGEVVCHGKVSARIRFDDVLRIVDLLIINDSMMTHDALIGIDVLAKGKVVIEGGTCRVMAIRRSALDIGSALKANIEQNLIDLVNAYANCFGEKLPELGKSRKCRMEINLTSHRPVFKKPYSIPIPKQRVVEEIVDELLHLGIIRRSNSLYASPVVLVRKQNGEDRLCVDFRGLNAITEKQPWLMPTVDGVLATLSGKKFFTTLDLMSGYYQIEVEENSKPFTAFVTPGGHFEFNRMPFGLRNAPCAFQRMMSELIAPLKKAIVSYVDEVIIATDTEEENLFYLEEFLKIIQQEGLTLRLSKCSFLRTEVSFLGHHVDVNGIRPGILKT